jgi:oxygen-independent coproporphyrinogen-3 oxidase
VARLIVELRARLTGALQTVYTIFIGGGTPTILPAELLAELLKAIQGATDAALVEEFTVEANPATIDDEKAALLVTHGVTRVSMGAQSFFPAELATLERLHSPEDIPPSVDVLRRHGVSQLNLDLIFGIPGQTLATWTESLRRAMGLGCDHIACYGLTYEPGTPLTAQRRGFQIIACDEDLEADMYLLAVDTLAAAGYRQYEISNFARPGCECQHNLIYWRNQAYIGVGPSAAGCYDGRRYKNIRDIGGYLRMIDRQSQAEAESELIDHEKLIIEMVMMQLRLNEGLSIDDFQSRIGVSPLELLADTISRLANQGLLEARRDPATIVLTRTGRLVAEAVIRELVTGIVPPAVSAKLPVLQ